jgi:acetyl esterase
MVLYPESEEVVASSAGLPAIWSEGYDIVAARRENRELALSEPREDVAEVLDIEADGVPCRLYRPVNAREGVVVHLHGGGFVFHDLDVHDGAARRLANRCRLAVLSVDYRLAPEHRFPAAPDDVSTVVRWLDGHADGLGIGGPTYVHGDSAGGNLALVAGLRHPGRFRAVALLYPFLDPTAGFDSYRTAADAFDQRDAEWYWQQYAASAADLAHPDLAPLHSDRLHTLPPTLVMTAEDDPLRDEGEHLALLLARVGVAVVGTRYLGQVHGFWRHDRHFVAADAVTRQVAGFFTQHS